MFSAEEEAKEKVNGIPDFWLKIFKNVEMLEDLVEPHDEPILKHLADITIEMSAKPMVESYSHWRIYDLNNNLLFLIF